MRTIETHGPALPINLHWPSVADIMTNTLRAGVSYRRYGLHGEQRRLIVHRFPASKLKCESSMGEVMAETITQFNPLLRALMHKGK